MKSPAISLYDASAGSGKTYTLVRQYLAIILSSEKDDAYRSILAITFTNKAVNEMKSRVVNSLSAIAMGEEDKKTLGLIDDLSSAIKIPPDKIRQKARRIIRHIIHNYAAFDISTIDKFTHRVIRSFAHELNLPASFEVSVDTEGLLQEAVDALIAKAGEDPVLTKILVDFTMEKTDDDKSWDITREMMETGKLAISEVNAREIALLGNRSPEDFIEIRRKLRDAAKCIDDDCVRVAVEAIAKISAHGIDPKSFSRGDFPNHLGYISRNELKKSHKKYRVPEDIRVNKGSPDRDAIDALVPELLEQLDTVYRNHERRDFYHAFLKNLTPLSMLSTLTGEIARIQQEQQVLSISEFNRIIHEQVKGQPAPFIYERIGERYRHFFIDEFQDTSEMQWENLFPLIDDATSSQVDGVAGSLLLVGDPKQSIYRFRGGKAEQFIALSKGEHKFNNKDFQKFPLDTNWRSLCGIVNFNNDFFEALAPVFTNEDYRELYARYCRQKDTGKQGGYVTIKFIPADPIDDIEDDSLTHAERYVRETIARVERARELGFEYGDIAVLTRKREQSELVAAGLIERGISIISSETLALANSTDVKFIINVLKCVRNPGDQEARAAFLLEIASDAGIPKHDFTAQGLALAERDFEAWLLGHGFDFSFASARRKSLYETAEEIVRTFLHDRAAEGYAQHFLDIVLERDLRFQSGVSDFLDYWERTGPKHSIPSPESRDAVRVMTIHKSKGLEFPVVILPFADENYARKHREKMWLDADEESIGLPRVLVDKTRQVADFGEAAASIYNQREQEELLDNVNILYVAMTRAEQQLHVISGMHLDKDGQPCKARMSTFFMDYLIQKNQFGPDRYLYEFGEESGPVGGSRPGQKPETIVPVERALEFSDIKISGKAALMWGTLQQEAIEFGNVIHEVMSFIATRHDLEDAIVKSKSIGLFTAVQEPVVRKTVQGILSHPSLEMFFDPANTVLNEQAIIRPNQPNVKPDRMELTPDNRVLLLDYKTGAHKDAYVDQLASYEESINGMGLIVAKKALVYTGREVNVINLQNNLT